MQSFEGVQYGCRCEMPETERRRANAELPVNSVANSDAGEVWTIGAGDVYGEEVRRRDGR